MHVRETTWKKTDRLEVLHEYIHPLFMHLQKEIKHREPKYFWNEKNCANQLGLASNTADFTVNNNALQSYSPCIACFGQSVFCDHVKPLPCMPFQVEIVTTISLARQLISEMRGNCFVHYSTCCVWLENFSLDSQGSVLPKTVRETCCHFWIHNWYHAFTKQFQFCWTQPHMDSCLENKHTHTHTHGPILFQYMVWYGYTRTR